MKRPKKAKPAADETRDQLQRRFLEMKRDATPEAATAAEAAAVSLAVAREAFAKMSAAGVPLESCIVLSDGRAVRTDAQFWRDAMDALEQGTPEERPDSTKSAGPDPVRTITEDAPRHGGPGPKRAPPPEAPKPKPPRSITVIDGDVGRLQQRRLDAEAELTEAQRDEQEAAAEHAAINDAWLNGQDISQVQRAASEKKAEIALRHRVRAEGLLAAIDQRLAAAVEERKAAERAEKIALVEATRTELRKVEPEIDKLFAEMVVPKCQEFLSIALSEYSTLADLGGTGGRTPKRRLADLVIRRLYPLAPPYFERAWRDHSD
jgi:hypothetical protein